MEKLEIRMVLCIRESRKPHSRIFKEFICITVEKSRNLAAKLNISTFDVAAVPP